MLKFPIKVTQREFSTLSNAKTNMKIVNRFFGNLFDKKAITSVVERQLQLWLMRSLGGDLKTLSIVKKSMIIDGKFP